MRNIAILLAMIFSLNSIAVAPYGVKGQAQTSTIYPNVHQVPNNQITNLGGINALIETGNINLLSNPGFEHSTFTTGWTAGGTSTQTAETSTIIHGKKAFESVASSQTFTLTQDSTLYASQVSGMQGLVGLWMSNTQPSCSICSRAAGVTSSTNCVTAATDGRWKSYEIPVVLSATSNGISVSCASGSGTTLVDEAYVGLMPIGRMPEVAQAQLAGESYFAATASCGGWTRTSTTVGAFSTDADCPGPTVIRENIGSWQTTDVDLPEQTVNNLPAGTYKARFIMPASEASGTVVWAINDGTTTCQQHQGSTTSSYTQQIAECTFVYTEAGDRSFELYTATTAGAVTMDMTTTTVGSAIRFMLEYYPPSSKIYSQNVDNTWVDCGLTSGDFAGFGTISSVDDSCKREGTDLLMNVRFTAGTVTAAEARVNLRLNGVALTSSPSPGLQASITNVGQYVVSDSGTQHGGVVFAEVSTAYVTFSDKQTWSGGSITAYAKAVGSNVLASSGSLSFTARIPISGWTSSPITGTFAEMMRTPSIPRPKTCYYYFGGASATFSGPTECTTGTCVEVYDSCGTGSPPTWATTGVYTGLIFAAGTFSNVSPVLCSCYSWDVTTAQVRGCLVYFATGGNSWASSASGGWNGNMFTSTAAGTASDGYTVVKCEGGSP